MNIKMAIIPPLFSGTKKTQVTVQKPTIVYYCLVMENQVKLQESFTVRNACKQ